MNDSFLSQEEIDALLRQTNEDDEQYKQEQTGDTGNNGGQDEGAAELTTIEEDALGEIGNISMGSAATTLSQLLNQKVTITTPRVSLSNTRDLCKNFSRPFLLIEIKFTQGLEGSNVLIMHSKDAAIIADLMMGGDGTNVSEELSEFHTSAVAEAMNQMMGSAATSMSTMFNKSINITPPEVTPVDFSQDVGNPFKYPDDLPLVVVSFELVIGDLVNSEIMQIIPVEIAKQQTQLLLSSSGGNAEEQTAEPQETVEEPGNVQNRQDSAQSFSEGFDNREDSWRYGGEEQPRNLDLILDVPLRISVVLGKTRKPIKEVLKMMPGAIVELDKLVNEPVEIYVNGKLIAEGEVVVINENFGVRLTHIISPRERLENLAKE